MRRAASSPTSGSCRPCTSSPVRARATPPSDRWTRCSASPPGRHRRTTSPCSSCATFRRRPGRGYQSNKVPSQPPSCQSRDFRHGHCHDARVRPGPHDAEYRARLTTPEDAVASVRNDALITFGPPVTEPPALLWALATRLRTGELGRLRVFSGPAGPHSVDSLFALDLVDQVEHLSHFVGTADRGKVAVGLGGYLPNHFHQLPRLITDYLRIDVALVSVSSMDRAGHDILGLRNDYTSTAARHPR